MEIIEQIQRLKKEKDIAILAHYYVDGAVQDIADYVGDSFYLSKMATDLPNKTIMVCGVSFMGESAKLLNPDKKILLPDSDADCPMAHMVDIFNIQQVKKQYQEDVAVVCYVNSTAAIKCYADVCVTSSNAYQVVSKLPQSFIYFIPDEHLGRYISEQLPDKTFIFNDGYCHVHTNISLSELRKLKEKHPDAIVVTHPECKKELLPESDFVGSTSEIIDYVVKEQPKECIVCTEVGVLHALRRGSPKTKFYTVSDKQICPNMKKITLQKVYQELKAEDNAVYLSTSVQKQASHSLENMMELAK